ncbi:MAG: hypothetical protein ICV54_11140 [Nostoc sp. C3-bin3]|nr:hypothetical protein [Nostoc sp. C3-bin3]
MQQLAQESKRIFLTKTAEVPHLYCTESVWDASRLRRETRLQRTASECA